MKKSLCLILPILLLIISFCHAGTSPAIMDAGKSTITCLIDGKQKTFTPQQGFFEISLGDPSSNQKDGLEILDGSVKREGFEFEFKKTGTTKIKTGGSGDMNCIINYYSPEGSTYTGNDVTIVVTDYSKDRLTGTFSGKLHNINYKSASNKNPEYIQITDGKIDMQR